MENKNKFWKGALVGALLTAFAGLIIVGMSLGIFLIGRTAIDGPQQAAESNQAENQDGSLDLNRITKKITTLQQIIDKYYLFDEDATKVEDWIYKGMMYGLNDPYTTYYTAEEYQKLSEDTEGEYHGIGVMISQNRSTGIITVIKVFKDTPAAEAGMRPGDVLYKVGDMEVTGMDMDILVKDYIKGKDGSEVALTVFRQDEGEYVDLKMERRNVTVQTVEYQMLEDHVGYIAVSQFDVVTADQFKAAVDDLEKQGMKKLLVDLRNNPGGVLDTVVDMLDYILPDDLIIEGDKDLVRTNTEATLLVYMADKNGKGGQEYGRATVVGTKTFGKGIVQNLIPLDNGTAIKMTTAHYYTPSGFDLHGKGIEPDVEVELKEELKNQITVDVKEDNQIQAALKALDK